MTNFINEWKKFLIKESGFNRIVNILQGNVATVRSVAFLTAENPFAQPLSKKENRELNKALMSWLRQRGYGPIRIRGHFGSPERSVVVPNMSRHDAIEAGKEFDQEAVIWGEKRATPKGTEFVEFEYIEGETPVQKRNVVLTGAEVQEKPDYYSQERQSAGRKFVIPFFDEEYEIDTLETEALAYEIPALTPEQQSSHKDLIKEINQRIDYSLDHGRTPKSRWHHRQLVRVKIKELKDNL
jgi:hypothetical protein